MKRTPNSVDLKVGARVRSRRLAVGLTQDKLAKAVGITFQQIQKYEKGVNRIGAGRLQAISRVLDAPVGYFYSENPAVLHEKVQPSKAAVPVVEGAAQGQEALELIKSFLKINDPEARRHLIGLADVLARRPAAAGKAAQEDEQPASGDRSVYRTV